MKQLTILFLGTPDFVQPIKDTLAQHFTLVDSLEQADLGVVAAYGKILTPEELTKPKYGLINVHPSLLPKYRGPSPIQQAILNGDKISGITIIKMDEEVDHGPIIYQQPLELSDSDNFDTLSKKMFLETTKVLPKIIDDFVSGKITPKIQDDTQATYCNRLTRESGYFDIDNPPSPETLNKMIRAYYPWPGVWTKWSLSRHPERLAKDLKIIKFYPGGKIQMEGKKAIPIKDFLNGYPNFPLTLL
ncbi:methionyl-tRNA formyltransferase [Patescibacteria group bacterium]|nr:methionyl-tRNA formyltransferase [Patescibacteria group bacterium]